MSTNGNHKSISKSSLAKGRIAQVLADARASLLEPSRPYTPLSFDQKIGNDMYNYTDGQNVNIADRKYNRISSRNHVVHNSIESNQPVSSTKKKSSTVYNNLKRNLQSNASTEHQSNESDSSINTHDESIKKSNEPLNHLKLLIADVKDYISAIEFEISADSTQSIGSSKNLRCQELIQLIEEPLKKLGKAFKENPEMIELVFNEMNQVETTITQLIFQMVNHPTVSPDMKQIFCCQTLKLISLIFLHVNHKSSSLSTTTLSTIQTIKRIIQGIYRIQNDNNSAKNKDSSLVFTSASSSSGKESDSILINQAIDLLLNLLSSIQQKVSLQLAIENSFPMETQPSSDETSPTFPILIELLDASSYAAAILRQLSTHDLHRKRLLHYPTLEVIHSLLQFSHTHPPIVALIKLHATSSTSTSSPSPWKEFTLRWIQILTQLIAIIRNFSLDEAGRHQLLSFKIVSTLCSLPRHYLSHPELILNCVRVTAKVSLYEPFRVQINSQVNHIKSLVNILIKEAESCYAIMEGTPTSKGEALDWPVWYTWPLLSRVCFTLGNLTTTNEFNRNLLGIDCKVLRPLLILLQACSGSLSQLHRDGEAHEASPTKQRTGSLMKEKSFGMIRHDSIGSGGDRGQKETSHNTPKTSRNKPFDMEYEVLEGEEEVDGDEGGEEAEREGEEDVAVRKTTTRKDERRYRDEDKEDGSEGEEEGEGSERGGIEVQDQSFPSPSRGQRHDEEEEGDGPSSEVELRDVTIKLIRLLTNVSISPQVGEVLCQRNEVMQVILELLVTSSSLCNSSIHHPYEEMLLNVIAASTNISFFTCEYLQSSSTHGQEEDPSQLATVKMQRKMDASMVTMSIYLSQCLFHDNEEIVLETCRVLGNITRRPVVLQSLLTNRTDEALILLLNHVNIDIVSAVTGAFVNMSADSACRYSLIASSSSVKIIQTFTVLLRRISFKNIYLLCLICKVLYNLLALYDNEREDQYNMLKTNLLKTLEELIDCAKDLQPENKSEDREKDKYQEFIHIGTIIVHLVTEE